MEKMEKSKKSAKSLLLYFSDQETEDLYKIWSKKYNVPAMDGYKVLYGQNGHEETVKQYQKVLLFVNIRNISEEAITKLQRNGFSGKDITLFTTYAQETELCEYAKKNGIRIIRLPLYKQKLKDFL
jgi:hypothetical protein